MEVYLKPQTFCSQEVLGPCEQMPKLNSRPQTPEPYSLKLKTKDRNPDAFRVKSESLPTLNSLNAHNKNLIRLI